MPAHATLHPAVNALLDALLSGAQTILCERFVGLYLYGSLASGHFDPGSSDIDFLVVTTEDLAEHTVSALEKFHARLAAGENRWARELDGDYIPQRALRRYDPADACYPHLGWSERLRVEGHGSDAILMRHTLREAGLTVAGPPPRTLIDPVSPEGLRQAVRTLAREWWAPALDDPSRLRDPHHLIYAILTLCRLLYTLEHGTLAPKPVAAHWALAALDARWHPLISRAAARETQPPELEEARAFLRETLARVGVR